MKIKSIASGLAICLCMLSSGYMYASDCQPKSNVEDTLQPPIPETLDPDDIVTNAINEWFSERCIEEGVEKQNKIYYSSVILVDQPYTSSHWIKSRQLAFERAMLEIRSQFIQDHYGKNANEVSQKYFSNDSSNNLDFKADSNGTSQVKAIYDKSVALTDEKLNQLLRENGLDPEQYHATPPAQKQAIFEDTITRNMLTKAMGESSGILSFKTFEANDENGQHAIGVITLYSPKLRQMAYDIAHGKEIAQSDKAGRSISSYYDISPEALTSTFGLRAVKDPEGNYVLISFSQWGYSYQGLSKTKQNRAKKAATKQAENLATSQITDFISSSLTFTDSSTIGESISDYLVKQGNDLSRKDESIIVDEILETIKFKSKGSTAGTRKVKNWSYEHPYGHQIVGSVKIWSRAGYEASHNVKNFTPEASNLGSGAQTKKKEESTASPTAILKIKPSIQSSPDFSDDSDF